MSVAERTLSVVKAVKRRIPLLEGDPIAEVPVNVPIEARKHFGWAMEITNGYLKKAITAGTRFDVPEIKTISYLMTEALTHRRIDLAFRNPKQKEKLKMAVTVVCKRGTQRASGFKLNRNLSQANRERFKTYRELATRAASLIINLTEDAIQPGYSYPPCQPMVDEMRRIRTNS